MQTYRNRELWLSFIAIILITILYLFVTSMLNQIPPASDFFGHAIGILGFVLMLMTESLYSLRKRSRAARWGKMSSWLEFHIFTGIVGPYLVLLHTSWKFNGLAGIVTLLTVIIVVSGFVGRYIYTAVPRTADGIEMEASTLNRQIAEADTQVQNILASSPEMVSQPPLMKPDPRLRWSLAGCFPIGATAWSGAKLNRVWMLPLVPRLTNWKK